MIDIGKLRPKFPLGRLLATRGAMDLGIDFTPYINRHLGGDWVFAYFPVQMSDDSHSFPRSLAAKGNFADFADFAD